MLLNFARKAWKPYLACLGISSSLLAILFSITSESGTITGVPMLVASIVLVAAPVILIGGMPVAFWIWAELQKRHLEVSIVKASFFGFLGGAGLHFLFLLCVGGVFLPLQSLSFALLCGGTYGATFAYFFTRFEEAKLDGANKTQHHKSDRAGDWGC